MTTLNSPARTLTADELTAAIDEYAVLDQAIRVTRRRLAELDAGIKGSLIAENATKFPHELYDVAILPGDPTYLVDRVIATLGEILPPADMAKLKPVPGPCKSCEGTGKAPERIDGVQANRIRRYGDRYIELLDQSCIRGEPRLKITPKGDKS